MTLKKDSTGKDISTAEDTITYHLYSSSKIPNLGSFGYFILYPAQYSIACVHSDC